MDAHPLGLAPVDGVAGQLLDGVQCLAPTANDGAQVLSLENHFIVALIGNEKLRDRFYLKVAHQTNQESLNLVCLLILRADRLHSDRLTGRGSGGLTNQNLVPLLETIFPPGTLPALGPGLAGLGRSHTRFGGQDGLLRHRGGGGLLLRLGLFLLHNGLYCGDDGLLHRGGTLLRPGLVANGTGLAVHLVIAHPDLGRVAAKAQKTGLGPLNYLH